MRKAQVVLHRKIDAQRKCICGSDMYGPFDSPTGDWMCKRQWRNKEQKSFMVEYII